ncbi:MAG: hypothetical protein IIX01_02540, partial [Clostridia bacterium]|nr:hypothetical protein [Clostridia bacterium]
NGSIETSNEPYVNNYFMEDYTFEEEVVDNSIEGPTLVKKIKNVEKIYSTSKHPPFNTSAFV